MKARVKRLWVRALRSGYFVQGHGRLRTRIFDGSRYCCLGVLCALAQKDGVAVDFIDMTAPFPPKAVRDWAGLEEDDMGELAALNDGAEFPNVHMKADFYDIALLIEEGL